jgi:hypothetical protein
MGSLTSHNPIGLQGLLRDSFTLLKIIRFLDFVHGLLFSRHKRTVSETGSVSVLRWRREGDTYSVGSVRKWDRKGSENCYVLTAVLGGYVRAFCKSLDKSGGRDTLLSACTAPSDSSCSLQIHVTIYVSCCPNKCSIGYHEVNLWGMCLSLTLPSRC